MGGKRSFVTLPRGCVWAAAALGSACQPPAARVEPGPPPPVEAAAAAPPPGLSFTPAPAADAHEQIPRLSPDTVPQLPVLWKHEAHGRPLLVAPPEGPGVLVFEDHQRALLLLDAASGSVRWRRAATGDDSWTHVTLAGDGAVVVHGYRGYRPLLLQLRVKDGEIIHRDELPVGYEPVTGQFGTGLRADDHEHCTARFRAGTGVFVGPVLRGTPKKPYSLHGPKQVFCRFAATVLAEVLGVTVVEQYANGRGELAGYGTSGKRWSHPSRGWTGLAAYGREGIFLRQDSEELSGDATFVRLDLPTGKIKWERAETRRDPCPTSMLDADRPHGDRVPGPPGHPEVLLVPRCGARLLFDADTGERLWERQTKTVPFYVGQDPPLYDSISGLSLDGVEWLSPDGSSVPRVEPLPPASHAVFAPDGFLLQNGDLYTMVEPNGKQRWQVRAEPWEATFLDGAFVLHTERGLALVNPGTARAGFALLTKEKYGAPKVLGRADRRSDVWFVWKEFPGEVIAVRFSR